MYKRRFGRFSPPAGLFPLFPIPANDDATKSITIILDQICAAIKEGLEERKNTKGSEKDAEVVAEVSEEVQAEASSETEANTEN